MNSRFSRRSFLKKSALGAAALAASRLYVPGILHAASRGDKLRVAVIGCGGRGASTHANECAREQIVAFVDADSSRFANAFKTAHKIDSNLDPSKIRTFDDYRKLFDVMKGQLDAISVATPNHHHALPAMMAMSLGIAPYVEKPLCYDIHEARELARLAAEKKVASQMGNQGHSGEGYRRLCEYIWAGAIGNVTEVYCWADRANGGIGPRPEPSAPPAGMAWDSWIGPAPFRQYHKGLHPHEWHGWHDFGNGSLGNMGCHVLDGAHWALKLGHPTLIECEDAVGGSNERYPVGTRLRWEFPAREGMPAVKLWWYDGRARAAKNVNSGGGPDDDAVDMKVRNKPPILLELEKKYKRKFDGCGTLYVGDKGILYTSTYGGGLSFVPDELGKNFNRPAASIPRIKGSHHTNFFNAVRGGEPACSHFGVASKLTEIVLLGCLAVKAGMGKKVQWDGPNATCTNLPEVNQYIARTYRKGWGV